MMSRYNKSQEALKLWGLTLLLLSGVYCLGDDGIPSQADEDGSATLMSVCASGAGTVLSTGRVYATSISPKQYLGYVRQGTTSATTGVTGDSTFQIAGATGANLNSTLAVKDHGYSYYDAFNTQGENLVVSCAYDSGRSVWWAVARAVKSTASGNRYVVVVLKIPTNGAAPTSFDTGIGGDSDNTSNNKHGLLGGPKSLVYDSSTDMLFFTGYQGNTNAYRPVFAQVRIASNVASNIKITALTTINGSSATGWRGVGVTQISAGGHVYGVASPIDSATSGFEAFDVTPATWVSGAWSGGSYTNAAVSLTGYTAYVKPTSIVNNASNTLYVSGAAKATAGGTKFGFVAALTTSLTLDTTNFNATNGFRADQISSKNTAYNDLIYVSNSNCDSGTARLFVTGYSYTGTNNKSLLGKITTAGALASWGTNNSGFYQLVEWAYDEINTAITYDSTNGVLVVGGRVQIKNSKWVVWAANYWRTYTACSSTTTAKYLSSCSGTLNGKANGVAFSIKKNSTFTGSFSFTYSDNSTAASQSATTANCSSPNTSIVSNPSAGTLTGVGMGGPVTVTCGKGLGAGSGSVNCGSWAVTVLSSVYGPGGNSTQMFAMLP